MCTFRLNKNKRKERVKNLNKKKRTQNLFVCLFVFSVIFLLKFLLTNESVQEKQALIFIDAFDEYRVDNIGRQ